MTSLAEAMSESVTAFAPRSATMTRLSCGCSIGHQPKSDIEHAEQTHVTGQMLLDSGRPEQGAIILKHVVRSHQNHAYRHINNIQRQYEATALC